MYHTYGMKNLSTASLYILRCTEEERHGYEIMQTITELSEGSVSVGPATLYTTLQRLLDQGLITQTREQVTHNGRVRRYYKITASGIRCLDSELEKLHHLLILKPRESK